MFKSKRFKSGQEGAATWSIFIIYKDMTINEDVPVLH